MSNRIRFELDQDADLSYLEQECFADVDPADIVSYGVILERQCDMGQWHEVDSVWGCDVMVADDPCAAGEVFAPADVPEALRFALEHFDMGTP